MRPQARLLNLASDAISVRNLDGTIRMRNQGAKRLYGWTAAEIFGHPEGEFIYQDTTRYEAATRELLLRGEWRGELAQVCKDGREITVSARWTLAREERGEPESILVIHTDITEQKNLRPSSSARNAQRAWKWEACKLRPEITFTPSVRAWIGLSVITTPISSS